MSTSALIKQEMPLADEGICQTQIHKTKKAASYKLPFLLSNLYYRINDKLIVVILRPALLHCRYYVQPDP